VRKSLARHRPLSAHFHKKHRRPRKEAGPRRERVEELHPIDEPPRVESFEVWDLGPEIGRAIAAMDISVPTPIQALSIGPILEGRDVIAKAQTGTGKTLAFGAPMMARIDAGRATVLGLVLCPTRELAQQVHGVLATLGLPRGVRVALAVGGDPIHPQIAELQAGAQVVVGTPGRVLDLYQQRFLSFPWTEYVVLDEADKMFEIGFLDDIKRILSYTPEERQTLLFSATFPTEVLKLAREATRNPMEVATASGTVPVETVDQRFMELGDDERPMALVRLLEQSGPKDVFLVFCGRRTEVDRLMRSLERAQLSIKALHGGYDQAARFRVMSAFRTGEVKALIATDVASRGLDVEHVTHVVNFSCPRDAEDYTHRIGRTGRAGRSGIAITFVAPADRRRWSQILGRTKAEVSRMEAPGRTGARTRRVDRAEERRAAPAAVAEDRAPRERAGPARQGDDAARAEAPRRRRSSRGGAPARSVEATAQQSREPTPPRDPHARRPEERAPLQPPRRKRRRRGGSRTRGERFETDGLGRWGDRADDFG
jgi:superfamily II DNA/RNA helicase